MVKTFVAAVCLGLLGSAKAQEPGTTHLEYIDYFHVLNVDHNIGLTQQDDTLRSVNYGMHLYDWGTLAHFKYFTAEIYNYQGTTHMKWWYQDGKYKKLVVKKDSKTLGFSNTELGVYPGDGLEDRWIFRRSKLTDHHGARPCYLSAILDDKHYALTVTDPKQHANSEVFMREIEKVDSWNRFYFARQVPMKDAHEVWKWVQGDSTYYFFNSWVHEAITTEIDEHHNLSTSGAWGDHGRMTLVQRESPYFDMFSYSKHTRDHTMQGSDFRVRTEANHLTIGVGGTVGFAYHKVNDEGLWGYFVNSLDQKKMACHAEDYLYDNSELTGSAEHWQMLRVYNDAATRVKSTAEEL